MAVNVLGHVLKVGREAASMPGRGMAAIGNRANQGLDAMEASMYNRLMQGRYEQARDAAHRVADLNVRTGAEAGFIPDANQAFSHYGDAYQATYNQELDRLSRVPRMQAAAIPGSLRFAGRMANSPLAYTAYGVAGTLAAGEMLESQANKAQLQQMGVAPEEAEAIANSMVYNQGMY
jgi:hypothetical protein